MKSFLFSALKLALLVGLLTSLIWYIHTDIQEYKRFSCNPAELKPHHICLPTVLEDWKENVLWIDARSQDAFERTATKEGDSSFTLLGLPIIPLRNDSQAEELLIQAMPALLKASQEDKKIVIFCDASCSSSEEIAQKLRNPNLGLQSEIYVLEGGWEALRRHPKLNHPRS